MRLWRLPPAMGVGFFPAATPPAATDPYWEYVVAMLPLTSDFSDKSNRKLVSTITGSPVIDTTDGAIGKGCLQAPRNSQLAVPVNAQVGSGEFTIEFFAKVYANQGAAYDGVAAFEAEQNKDYNLFNLNIFSNAFSSSNARSWDLIDNAQVGSVDDSTWHHWCFERKKDTVYMYRDGVLKRGNSTGTGKVLTPHGPWAILGKKADLLNGVEVRIQYFRFTKGIARYNGADSFSPPTVAFPTRGPSTATDPY